MIQVYNDRKLNNANNLKAIVTTYFYNDVKMYWSYAYWLEVIMSYRHGETQIDGLSHKEISL